MLRHWLPEHSKVALLGRIPLAVLLFWFAGVWSHRRPGLHGNKLLVGLCCFFFGYMSSGLISWPSCSLGNPCASTRSSWGDVGGNEWAVKGFGSMSPSAWKMRLYPGGKVCWCFVLLLFSPPKLSALMEFSSASKSDCNDTPRAWSFRMLWAWVQVD